LNEDYQKEFEPLLSPSTFPTSQLEMNLLTVYYPNAEEITDKQETKATIDKEIADKTWQTIRTEILELTSQELSKNPSEEELKKLVFKIMVDNQNGYEITIQYHQQSPLKEKIEELIKTVPLQSEAEHSKQVIEELKKEKEQLPTPENFEKLQKQNQE
jgi:formyltetrahydrofolate synthetase